MAAKQEISKQTTLKGKISYTGLTLHSGEKVTLHLSPARAGTGYVFVRTDLHKSVQANIVNLRESERCTLLEQDGARVRTPEHLLAALYGLGVDNAIISLSGEEVPMGDGSSATWVELIQKVGIRTLSAPRLVRRIEEPIWAVDGTSFMLAFPAPSLEVAYIYLSDHPLIGCQFRRFVLTPEVFLQELSRARTIAFLQEVEALRARGLGLGGNMDVAVVVGENEYLGPLRYPDEIVRHKLLDLVGDMAVLGPLAARVVGIKSGHSLNARLARRIAFASHHG